MDQCENKLKELIENIVIIDIEDHIDDIFEQISKNKNVSDEKRIELEEMHKMRIEFLEILNDIKNKVLNQDECHELYEEMVGMID